MRGGEEVFIIGKNFLKGTKVIFQENIAGTVAVSMLLVLSLVFMRIHVSAFKPPSGWKKKKIFLFNL